MKYHHSQNCAVNSPTMFRNVCVFALVVLCGHAASAMSTDMVVAVATKIGGQMIEMGMACLAKTEAADVMKNPTPEKVVQACGCLAGCAAQGLGVMTADGKVNTGLIEKAIPEKMPMGDKMKQVLKDCGSKGGDTCHSTMNFMKCACADGPMKEIMATVKSYATALVVEAVKAAM